ncbi:hypothetical protein P167DRAFT_576129 [Morchella conica CCBAS932]|uniref:Uncharacterized protein n=1 Tax=Morchella conica CCBAS932 TaxID=1392247 RepID=A0A3N4KIY1_9PEZI|nr:hypothetical protein P167DRAFT_576129 [Morchella conica CCBAS932]
MGQSSNSTSSETSASSVTSAAALIPLSTGPSFKSDGSGMNRTDRPRNEDARLENFHSYSDDDRLRKRFKGDTSTQNQWSSEGAALGRVYGDLEYGELARSKIFHGSQTFAVVIGSRSRSTSASADGKQNNHQGGHQDFGHAVAARISQGTSERLTKRTSITSRSSPPPAALTSYNEDLSVLKQARLPSEIKDSQEMDYELVDAQMSLDSADLHSPMQERTMHNYQVHNNMASETLGRTTPYWGTHEQNGPFSRYERPSSYDNPRPPPEDNSPQYSPSVGDRERNEAERSINREYREASSPPYSPPPPDVDVLYEGPVKDLTHMPLPQTTQQEQPKNSDNWFSCVMCNFYIQNNGQYKNNICGSCALNPVPPRNSRVIQEPPQPTAQRTARQARHQAGQKPYRRRVRKHPKHFKPTSSTGFPNHEAPKGSTPEEFSVVPAARKFQTSKDRVNEKYPMNEPVPSKPRAISVLRKNKDEEPIKNTLELRASCDISDKGGKPEAVATNGKSRRPVRPSNFTGPARKFPSTPISHESPPPGVVSSTERPVSRNDNNPPKKIPPRRPAVKNAGGSIQFTDSDDSDEPVGDRATIIMLQKKLAEQKNCTKNQRNKVIRLQGELTEVKEELTEATRETKRVREEFSAKLAQARKIKKSDPVQLDINDETKACDLLVKLTTGKLAPVPLKLKDLYKDIDFTASSPWPCPPELPEPDPKSFRKPGWRKKAPEYDTKRMMKVHLHRQLPCAKTQPPKIIPGSLHDLSNAHMDSRSNSLDDEYSEYSLGGLETTIDEFLGFPENMVPAVKDGVLGFRPGIINQRTRRLDRNVQHYKVRTPGALLDRI